MKLIYYYELQPTGIFTGNQKSPVLLVNEQDITLIGGKKSPGSVLKLAAGNDAWLQDSQSIMLLDNTLTIATLNQIDWTDSLKKEWVKALCKHVNCYEIAENENFVSEIVTYFSTLNLYQLLSGAAIAYAEKNISTEEVSIGLGMCEFPFLLNYASITQTPSLKNSILTNHQDNTVYVSHLARVSYLTKTKICYCFGGNPHPYNINYSVQSQAPLEQLAKGGGSVFGEVKLAGKQRMESYLVKKNIDASDPTSGLYSGTSENLCVGDNIYLIDNSTYTTKTQDDWTWFGDYNQVNYTWFVADITYPTEDFPGTPANYMNFPIEVIEQMTIDDFAITKPVK